MAVYTEIDQPTLSTLLERYAIGTPTELKGIAEGVENSNYLLTTSERKFILTIYEKRVEETDLPFFIQLMQHLAARGIPCPIPIADKHHTVLQRLHGKPAAIVSFLEGKSTRTIQNHHLVGVGTYLAKMHLAAESFNLVRPNNFSLATWQSLHHDNRAKLDSIHTGLEKEIAAELYYLALHWPVGLPSGVIHADLFPDNVFFEGKQLSGIIDFYFACNDFFLYDLAIVINAWCFEHDVEFNITKARFLLAAYNKVRPIAPEELKALPVLCRGAALRFLLTRSHDWLHPQQGALVTPKDPLQYLKRLHFHQQVESHGAYGL